MSEFPLEVLGGLESDVRQLLSLRAEIRHWWTKRYPNDAWPGYTVALHLIRKTSDAKEDSQNTADATTNTTNTAIALLKRIYFDNKPRMYLEEDIVLAIEELIPSIAQQSKRKDDI